MPSKRYSFVRGRPPLMRGRTEFGGSATPGAIAASMMNSRPFSGSWTICSSRRPFRGSRSPRARSARRRPRSPALCTPPTARSTSMPRLLTGRQTNALAAHGPEPGQLDIEAVFARRQADHGVQAIAGGRRHSLAIRPGFRDGDRRARNGGSRLIFHETGDLAGGRLGMRRAVLMSQETALRGRIRERKSHEAEGLYIGLLRRSNRL